MTLNTILTVLVLGKCLGSLCAISGVLLMSIPIPIIVNNFQDFYSRQGREEAGRRRRARRAEMKEEEEGRRVEQLTREKRQEEEEGWQTCSEQTSLIKHQTI